MNSKPGGSAGQASQPAASLHLLASRPPTEHLVSQQCLDSSVPSMSCLPWPVWELGSLPSMPDVEVYKSCGILQLQTVCMYVCVCEEREMRCASVFWASDGPTIPL